jgi:hypothetical protein
VLPLPLPSACHFIEHYLTLTSMGASMTLALPTDPPAEGIEVRGRVLLVLRLIWFAFVAFVLTLCAVSMPTYLRDLAQPCAGATCQLDGALTAANVATLRAAGISAHQYAVYSGVLFSAVIAFWLCVGLLIFLRRGHELGALIIALILATANPSGANGPITALALRYPEWSLPVTILTFLSSLAFAALFLLFPDGRLVPRWMIWVVLVYVAQSAMTAFLPPDFPLNSPTGPGNLISAGVFLATAGCLLYAQIYRYRHASTARQRAQTKWGVLGLLTALIGVLALNIIGGAGSLIHIGLPAEFILNTLFPVILVSIPLSIGIAILRSRLYDIDVIINRALVYGTLTALLAAIYFALVLGMQTLTRALVGAPSQSPVVIVVSTLVIAALFQPLRRRLQRTIDRRFYRQRYDAVGIVSSFAVTLRQEVELASLHSHLLTTVEETMRPAHVSLWLAARAAPSNQAAPREV